MKTAIDCYDRGKQKEIDADQFPRKLRASFGRFICPECGEYVHLKSSKYSNFFAHYKKTAKTAECDRRITIQPTESLYERMGLPIYLCFDESIGFSLCFGFSSLPESVLEQAEKDQVSLSVLGSTYFINRQKFSSQFRTLIPIEYIPFDERPIQINYSPAENASIVKKYWSDYSDAFYNSGALFKVTVGAGRKVRHSDSINTGEEYYWLRRQDTLPNGIIGIDMDRVGTLRLRDASYTIFKGTFRENLSEDAFSKLEKYLREHLYVFLLEQKPLIYPVWPPIILREDECIIEEECQNVVAYIYAGDDIATVYQFSGTKSNPDIYEVKSGLHVLDLKSSKTSFNIDRKFVSNGTVISKSKYIYGGKEAIYVIDEEEPKNLYKYQDYAINPVENHRIESSVELEYIVFNRDGEIISVDKTTNYVISKDAKLIIALLGGVISFLCRVRISGLTIQERKTSIDEQELLDLIKKAKSTYMVNLPFCVRSKIVDLLGNSKSIELKYRLLEYVRTSRLPAIILNYMEK